MATRAHCGGWNAKDVGHLHGRQFFFIAQGEEQTRLGGQCGEDVGQGGVEDGGIEVQFDKTVGGFVLSRSVLYVNIVHLTVSKMVATEVIGQGEKPRIHFAASESVAG